MPTNDESVRALLDALDTEGLKQLCVTSNLAMGRANDERRARLAAAYDGDFEEMLIGLRKADLERVLKGRQFRVGARSYELGAFKRALLDDLRRVARAVFVRGWLPASDGDAPVRGLEIRAFAIETSIDERDVDTSSVTSVPGSTDELVDAPGREAPGRPQRAKERIDPWKSGPEGRHDAQLESFQRDAVAALARHYEAPAARGMLCLPTGGGKTRTSLEWLLTTFTAARKRILWVTHRVDLLDQVRDDLEGLAWLVRARRPDGFSVSRYYGDHDDLTGDIVLASAQSLASRSPSRADVSAGVELGIVVYDEAHRAVATGTWEVLRKILGEPRRTVPILGLTATPFRVDDDETRDLIAQVGAPIYRRTFKDLVDLRFLARPIFYRHEIHSKVIETVTQKEIADAKRGREIPASVLSRLARDASRNKQIVDRWSVGRVEFGKTLVFACDIDHADALTNEFARAGARVSAVYSGAISPEVRAARIKAFKDGDLEVLVNVGILTEGSNLPSTKTVVLARPTMSESLYLQMIGRGARGQRAVPGKETFYVIDCVDNFARHGLTLAGRELALSLAMEGVRPAANVQSAPADASASTTPRAAADPATRSRVERELLRALALLRARGFALAQCSFWGELRWAGVRGTNSVAVFAETISPIEPAIALVKDAHATGQWHAVYEQGPRLDAANSVRAADWKRLVEDCRATKSIPELVPIDGVALDEEIHPAEQLLGLARHVANLPFAAAAAAIRDAFAATPEFCDRFGSESSFRDEIVALCAAIEAPATPSPSPAAMGPTQDDAILAFAEFAFALARVDGPTKEAERLSFALAVDQIFDVGAHAVGSPLAAALKALEFAPTCTFDDATSRIRERLDWSTRVAAYDWLFRVAVADGALTPSEHDVLRQAAVAFELPQSTYLERVAWYGESGSSDADQTWQGYVTCSTCHAVWESRANYCGDCGTDLRGRA